MQIFRSLARPSFHICQSSFFIYWLIESIAQRQSSKAQCQGIKTARSERHLYCVDCVVVHGRRFTRTEKIRKAKSATTRDLQSKKSKKEVFCQIILWTSSAPNWYCKINLHIFATWSSPLHTFSISYFLESLQKIHFQPVFLLLPLVTSHNHNHKVLQSELSFLFSSFIVCAYLPSACEWKTTTEAAVDGWEGLLIISNSFAVAKEGDSVGSSLRETLAGRAGSSASMGAMMQWDSRHSGFTLKTTRKHNNSLAQVAVNDFAFAQLCARRTRWVSKSGQEGGRRPVLWRR